jgi:hypothetical protein
MRGAGALDPTAAHRHRYIIEDPIRFSCLCAAGTLFFVSQPSMLLTFLVVVITQLAPVVMAARAMEQGWSHRWGRAVHPSVYASSLAMDFTNLSACVVVGSMLLIRHFNGTEMLKPLAILAGSICFLPDVRLCRWLLAGEPVRASFQLRQSSFLRDPVMLAALLATGVMCVLDRTSLLYVILSIVLFGLNTILVIVDKYLAEVEVTRFTGWTGLLLEREGRRLWLVLAPMLLAPYRLVAGDRAAWWAAGLIAAAVVAPDLVRLALAGLRALANGFRMTPAPAVPATFIVLPK